MTASDPRRPAAKPAVSATPDEAELPDWRQPLPPQPRRRWLLILSVALLGLWLTALALLAFRG